VSAQCLEYGRTQTPDSKREEATRNGYTASASSNGCSIGGRRVIRRTRGQRAAGIGGVAGIFDRLHGESVCVQVYGQQRFVSQVEVIRYQSNLCDYQGRMVVFNASGSKIDDRWSNFHSGCSHGAGWFDWYPNVYYPNNSRVCGYWYQSHGQFIDAACETVHNEHRHLVCGKCVLSA